MKRKTKNIKIFLRSAIMTAVVIFCIATVFLGICKCYSEIQKVSFGQEKAAVEIGSGYFRILDFEIWNY